MSSTLNSLLSVTFGLLWEKVRDTAAEKLKEGDITDEKCRQIIVRELEDIKSKLDGLARKDLMSSVSFLKEGVRLFNLSLHKSTTGHDSVLGRDLFAPGLHAVGLTSAEIGVATADGARLQATQEQSATASETRVSSAKASFKAAREKATEAFSNDALSIEDRILATKLRIVSRILDSLDDPIGVAESCKLYLEELHNIPAVRKMFLVYYKGGLKSWFNETKRLLYIRTVITMNYWLVDFIKSFANSAIDIFAWPKIMLGKRFGIHPIMDTRLIETMRKKGKLVPSKVAFNHKSDSLCPHLGVEVAAVDSKGRIAIKYGRSNIVIFNNKGDMKLTLCPSAVLENEAAWLFKVCALVIDGLDHLYIAGFYKIDQETFSNRLVVFDARGDIKKNVALDFLEGSRPSCMASMEGREFIVIATKPGSVFVCDWNGRLKYRFSLEERYSITSLAISGKNEILAEVSGRSVGVYTEKGELLRKIEYGRDHSVRGQGIAFSHITLKLVVLTAVKHDGEWRDHQLECYTMDGELLQKISLPEGKTCPVLTSHPNGPVALVRQTEVLYV